MKSLNKCASIFDRSIYRLCILDFRELSKPENFNTDQGSQFTSREFASKLTEASVEIRMDGRRGRATDNLFIERLWRTVKYVEINL